MSIHFGIIWTKHLAWFILRRFFRAIQRLFPLLFSYVMFVLMTGRRRWRTCRLAFCHQPPEEWRMRLVPNGSRSARRSSPMAVGRCRAGSCSDLKQERRSSELPSLQDEDVNAGSYWFISKSIMANKSWILVKILVSETSWCSPT